jgi:hypothetical protein
MSNDPLKRSYSSQYVMRRTKLQPKTFRDYVDRRILRATPSGRPGKGGELRFSFRDLLTAVILANFRLAGMQPSRLEKVSAVLYGSAWAGKRIIGTVNGEARLLTAQEFRRFQALGVPCSGIDMEAATTTLLATIEFVDPDAERLKDAVAAAPTN